VRQYAMSGNMVGGFYTSAIGFGWNDDVLKKKHLPPPKCWADLTDPKYKGEIETSHPASSGTAYTILAGLVQLMGEDAAFEYLKKVHRNVVQYTRSGTAQAKSVAPCEGTSYEIGGIALVKGSRNPEAARRYYDWLMSPAGQAIGARANSLQFPANKTFKLDPRIPSLDNVRLIRYDFEKYGKAAERKRLIDRWQREVEAMPK